MWTAVVAVIAVVLVLAVAVMAVAVVAAAVAQIDPQLRCSTSHTAHTGCIATCCGQTGALTACPTFT